MFRWKVLCFSLCPVPLGTTDKSLFPSSLHFPSGVMHIFPSLLPRLNFTPDSLPPPPEQRRDWGMGVAGRLSHAACATPSSSGGRILTLFPCSNVGPSHGTRFSKSCSSISPSHGMQFFRDRMLQCESLMGSHVLPANLF